MSAERETRYREPPPRQNLSDSDRLRLLTEMRYFDGANMSTAEADAISLDAWLNPTGKMSQQI
jgi:hypothetical protein